MSKKKTDPIKISLFFRKNRMWILLVLLSLVLLLFVFRGEKADGTDSSEVTDFYAYTQVLRQDLESTLSQMSGVGKCTVLITFSDGGETVYAYDQNSSSTSDGKSSVDREYVLVSSRSEGLVLKVHSPSVSGVAVICEGGDSTRVKSDVTEVLSCTLGISADRISVKKRNYQE